MTPTCNGYTCHGELHDAGCSLGGMKGFEGAQFQPELIDAARGIYLEQIKSLQGRIANQKRELRALGRAHQVLCITVREERRQRARWVKSWQDAGRYNSRLGEEIRRLNGWSLKQFHEWQAGLKWEEMAP